MTRRRQRRTTSPGAGEKPATEQEADARGRTAAKGAAKEAESFLHWVLRCSGFIGLVILLLSIYFVSTVGRLFWEMRVEVAAPPEIVPQCEDLLGAARLQGNLQPGARRTTRSSAGC